MMQYRFRPIPTIPVRPPVIPVRPPAVPGADRLNPITIDPALVEVIRKGQARAHKPYVIKDPNSGGGREDAAKPVAREAVLTFPNGKKVQAGKYYDELNRFEQHVNQFGYSLRDDGDVTIPFSRLNLNQVEFDRKRNDAIAKHDAAKFQVRLPVDVIKRGHDTELARIPDFKKD